PAAALNCQKANNVPAYCGAPPSMLIRPFRPEDQSCVIALWQGCGLTRPWDEPQRDNARKMTEHPELFLVGDIDGHPVATAMVGFDGHRGWVYYLTVQPGLQGKGYGRMLM